MASFHSQHEAAVACSSLRPQHPSSALPMLGFDMICNYAIVVPPGLYSWELEEAGSAAVVIGAPIRSSEPVLSALASSSWTVDALFISHVVMIQGCETHYSTSFSADTPWRIVVLKHRGSDGFYAVPRLGRDPTSWRCLCPLNDSGLCLQCPSSQMSSLGLSDDQWVAAASYT